MSFTEYTVFIEDENFGGVEIMVHVDESFNIIRAYTYVKDVEGLYIVTFKNGIERESSVNKFLSKKKRLNPLFVDFNQRFIDEYQAQLSEAVSDEIEKEA